MFPWRLADPYHILCQCLPISDSKSHVLGATHPSDQRQLFTGICPLRGDLKPFDISGTSHYGARVGWPFSAALLPYVHMDSIVSEGETLRRGACSQKEARMCEPFRFAERKTCQVICRAQRGTWRSMDPAA
jgi:hypothetical protein